jgi:hypothetical protein
MWQTDVFLPYLLNIHIYFNLFTVEMDRQSEVIINHQDLEA